MIPLEEYLGRVFALAERGLSERATRAVIAACSWSLVEDLEALTPMQLAELSARWELRFRDDTV